MGICQSNNENDKKNKKSNRGKQPYCAPVKDFDNNSTANLETTVNTASQIDLMSQNEFNKKPSQLYKYSGHYYKKGEQISLMTISLHEMQGNSNSLNNKTKNSQIYIQKNNNSIYNTSCIDENDNESYSDDVIEIINDGKMDENMVKKSADKTTIDNYNLYIGKNEPILKKNKIDIYNNKKCDTKINDNSFKKNDDNKDVDSIISGIPSSPFNTFKFGKKK